MPLNFDPPFVSFGTSIFASGGPSFRLDTGIYQVHLSADWVHDIDGGDFESIVLLLDGQLLAPTVGLGAPPKQGTWGINKTPVVGGLPNAHVAGDQLVRVLNPNTTLQLKPLFSGSLIFDLGCRLVITKLQ